LIRQKLKKPAFILRGNLPARQGCLEDYKATAGSRPAVLSIADLLAKSHRAAAARVDRNIDLRFAVAGRNPFCAAGSAGMAFDSGSGRRCSFESRRLGCRKLGLAHCALHCGSRCSSLHSRGLEHSRSAAFGDDFGVSCRCREESCDGQCDDCFHIRFLFSPGESISPF